MRSFLSACLVFLMTTFTHGKPPTPEQLEKVKEAMPRAAQAEPRQPRKVLVFSRTTGFRHSSIEIGAEAFRIMGEMTGAFSAEHTEDPAAFTAENLKRFDAVVFLNTTGKPLETDAQMQALLEFVEGGKGLMGVHSATDTFYQWPAYGEMMGGYFAGHPWHEKVTLKIEDPDHACNRCFKGEKNYAVTDEIYQFREEPYSRQKLRILTSLDTDLTNMNKRGIRRGKDGDYGVSWLRTYKRGRVFYCSLGHREEIYWNPTVLAHYLAGLQFVLGDLEADTTPSAMLTKE